MKLLLSIRCYFFTDNQYYLFSLVNLVERNLIAEILTLYQLPKLLGQQVTVKMNIIQT